MSDERHRVLHTLAIRGLIDQGPLAVASGLDEETVADLTTALMAEGLVVRREGRIEGFMLSPDGRVAHEVSLADERGRADLEALAQADAGFVEVNEPFKQLCTRWQATDVDVRRSDELGRNLADIHRDALDAVRTATRGLGRFEVYGSRLSSAYDRFESGDDAALLRPLNESYHDVWMELHHDLLLTIGRARGEGDGH